MPAGALRPPRPSALGTVGDTGFDVLVSIVGAIIVLLLYHTVFGRSRV
jgi:hypothetical protein